MARIAGLRRAFRLPWSSAARVDREVNEELTFHLDMKTQELIDQGATPEDARRRAREQFGDLEYTRRYLRSIDHSLRVSERRAELLDELRQDAGYGLRQLRRNPGFTIVALLTLTLGIGANTAMFSVVRGIVFRELPYADPGTLLRVFSTSRGRLGTVSPPDFTDWRKATTTFAGLAASYDGTINLTGTGEPERLTQARVSDNLFAVLGVRPALGRGFIAGEESERAPRVVVLSDGLWRRRFAADSSILGRTITLDGYATEVVGVAPPDLRYPAAVDMWLTTRFTDNELAESSRGARWIQVIGRVKPGVTADRAQAEMTEIARRIEKHDPKHNSGVGASVLPLHEHVVGRFRGPLLMLLSAVALVLLIACANVASLLLGRTAARDAELAVRTALGAGRARLVRQLLTESLCLAMVGGALGLLLAHWGTRALLALAPSDIPRLYDVRVDGAVLAFTLAVTLLAALLFGLAPALQASTSELALHLRDGHRGSRTRPGSARTRGALVVGVLAMAIMLLAGAGLLLRSFARLRDVSPGFEAARVTTFNVSLSPVTYPTYDRQRAFGAALLERVRRIPGVESAGLAFGLPLTGTSFVLTFDVAGRAAPPPNAEPAAQVRIVSAEYFRTMGIPLVRGRAFTADDRPGARQVVLISQETARRFFADEDPIGKQIDMGWKRDSIRLGGEIVGVVGDVRQHGLAEDVTPHVYALFDQWPIDELAVVLRSRAEPQELAAAVRSALASLDRQIPVYGLRPLDEIVSASLGQPRFYLVLLAGFATAALLLAAVGIYGVIAYTVQQRTREIGIRIALGATPDRMVRMVVGRGLALAVAGVVLGIAGAFAVTRVLRSLLYGVSDRDPMTFVGVAVLLGLVAMVASWVPARRATRIDPLAAMRAEG